MKNITQESAQEFETESQIMARLRSPNIVQFYGYSITPERCIVMEYCPNGSLFSVLHSDKPLEWPVRVKIALCAAKGVTFLHHENILHRDIKSLNILLTEHFEAKLTDFGLSKLKTETKSHAIASKTNIKDSVGTIQWMAPELFRRNAQFTQKSDIYSLGVTFWELSSRKVPFSDALDASLIKDWVKDGERETIPQDCPPGFGTLIQECWDGEPSKRPDSNSIITQLEKSLEAFSVPKTSNAPSASPSPFPAPSGPQYLSNFVSESAPKPVVFSSPAKPLPPQAQKTPVQPNTQKPQPTASAQAVATFLKLIAEGEQEQAEGLLQKDPNLALMQSDVTDLSGRTFYKITGFQYALWALDWHMWRMIIKYMPDEEVRLQLQGLKTGLWVKTHGLDARKLIQNLLEALQSFIENYASWPLEPLNAKWCNGVGNAQKLIPVHVINEYCHPYRSFQPCPNFADPTPIPRSRKIDKGEWFTATHNSNHLGETFACLRFNLQGCLGVDAMAVPEKYPRTPINQHHWQIADQRSINILLLTRIKQRDELLARYSERLDTGFIKDISPEAAAAFVRLVAEGEQDQAEGLLQKDPNLALMQSDVTDLSGRTFHRITGFQYAVWALDWHMWRMIKKYMPDEEVRLQLEGLETGSWVNIHGLDAKKEIRNLINALEYYIKNYSSSPLKEVNYDWCERVGNAQKLIPVHVINEYCHPHRSFDPVPVFKDPARLPRTRNIDKGEWFTAIYNSGVLGKKFACLRFNFKVCWGGDAMAVPVAYPRPPINTGWQINDSMALTLLEVTRSMQRKELLEHYSIKSKASAKPF